jgi:murein L,D-transpeptidase YafK
VVNLLLPHTAAAILLLTMISRALADTPPKTVEDRVQEFGAIVQERLAPKFAAAGVPYPPQRLTLIGFKQEKVLQVYASGPDGEFRHICDYPVLAASGVLGPKLREGDRQVPEGIYRVPLLNPNSRFHLSIRLNYPNEFDLARAAEEGRKEPGTDIMIHGDEVSIGCLAVGDPAAEDLFVLAALTGIENITVILSPVDFRVRELPELPATTPKWAGELHEMVKQELARYPTR